MEYRSIRQQIEYSPTRAFEGMYTSTTRELYTARTHHEGDGCC